MPFPTPNNPPRTLDAAAATRELISLSALKDPVARVAPLWCLRILLQYLRHLGLPTPASRRNALPDIPSQPPDRQSANVAEVCEKVLLISMGAKQWPSHSLYDYTNRTLFGLTPPEPPPDPKLLNRRPRRPAQPRRPRQPKAARHQTAADDLLPT